jgi:hypothetical protein
MGACLQLGVEHLASSVGPYFGMRWPDINDDTLSLTAATTGKDVACADRWSAQLARNVRFNF